MKTSYISSAIFIIITVLSTGIVGTEVSQCINSNAPLPEVEIKDCDVPPCIFYINSTGEMTMKFRAPRYLEHIAPLAQATVLGLTIGYPLDQADACDGVTNTPCPLADGEYIEYTYGMFILPIFPAIALTLEFSLVDLDLNSEPFECFNVDLQLE